MFIDTHAHLFSKNFENDLTEVIKAAAESNVKTIIVPATDLASARQVLDLCRQYENIFGTIGIHPHDCKDWSADHLRQIQQMAANNKITAIGEIGLDYFYDFTPKLTQQKAFNEQLELALEMDLPVVVHNRDSDEDMLNIIKSFSSTGLKAQFHCFNSSARFADEVLALGHYISFTGNITFRKADTLRSIVRGIPLNRIMLETDAPFMTPVPYRGKRNEPKYIMLVAAALAELHDTTVDEIAAITTGNAVEFFNLDRSGKLTFTYKLGNSLYINITNRCNAGCVFCSRKDNPILNGYNLGMNKAAEPEAEIYINQIGDPAKYSEIVFCGYGEPTIRWDIVKAIARYTKDNGGKTRLNTNGHGNIINRRDITPECEGLLDSVSISLNSHDRKQYAELMNLPESYYDEMLNFAALAKRFVPQVVLSVVDYPGIDIEASKKIASDIGVEFRLRPYF